MSSTVPTSARLYFRPTGFIDAPFGFDGQFERLAGGLQFFSQWHVIAVDKGVRCGSWLLPIEAVEAFIAALGEDQQALARQTLARITQPRAPLQLGARTIHLDQPQVMGILNMTPDSFSGGSSFLEDPKGAADAAVILSAEGAALIDIGGESTRPTATTVWEEDELKRVLPVIEALVPTGTALSIDTRKAAVMERSLSLGAHMINDVSALRYDPRALEVLARSDCPIVLMHAPGKGDALHGNDHYADPLIDVYDWLEHRIEEVVSSGISRTRIIADPGIGFGKGVAHNLAVLNGLSLFHGLGVPLLLGASRKRLIGALANEAPTEARLPGSLALALKGAEQGVQLIRVHDVAETVQALKVWRGLRDQALSPV